MVTPNDYSLPQKCAAEFFGTAMIIYGGCGFVCAERFCTMWPAGPLAAPLVFGVAVSAAVYGTRDISGAHLNPAITVSFAVNRPDICPPSHVVPYIAS